MGRTISQSRVFFKAFPDEDLLKDHLICPRYALDIEHLLCAGHAMPGSSAYINYLCFTMKL